MIPDYSRLVERSERHTWRLSDVLAEGRHFDFTRPFLPEALCHAQQLELGREDTLRLNQIRAASYLHLFGLVEEFILPFVVDHARPELPGSSERVRALLRFAEEEAKHIELFRRFSLTFARGFGTRCEGLGQPEALAQNVLARPPFAVVLAILHIEWLTQDHYLRSVKDADDLEPAFKQLLRYHWVDEAQHAHLDTLLAHEIADTLTPDQRQQGFAGYLEILSLFDGGLREQTRLDLESFRRAGGQLIPAHEPRWLQLQHDSYREVFLRTGLRHPGLVKTVEALVPDPDWTAAVARFT